MGTVRDYVAGGGGMPGSDSYTGGSSTVRGDIAGSGSYSSGGSSGGARNSNPTKAEVRVLRSTRSNVFYYNPITESKSTAETSYIDRAAYTASIGAKTGVPSVVYNPNSIFGIGGEHYDTNLGRIMRGEQEGYTVQEILNKPLTEGLNADVGLDDKTIRNSYLKDFPETPPSFFQSPFSPFSGFGGGGSSGGGWLDGLKNSGLLIMVGIVAALLFTGRK